MLRAEIETITLALNNGIESLTQEVDDDSRDKKLQEIDDAVKVLDRYSDFHKAMDDPKLYEEQE